MAGSGFAGMCRRGWLISNLIHSVFNLFMAVLAGWLALFHALPYSLSFLFFVLCASDFLSQFSG